MNKHTPGPWRWEYNAEYKSVKLCGGKPQYDKTVMDFTRWGMGGAQPRFLSVDRPFLLLHKLSDMQSWVEPFPGREHHANWCAAVNHPDARLMAAAPDLLEALETLYAEADNFSVSGVYFNEECMGHVGLKMARDAIAKAKGESA